MLSYGMTYNFNQKKIYFKMRFMMVPFEHSVTIRK